MAKKVTVRDGGHILLEDFRDTLDVDKVVYYKLSYVEDEDVFKVTFYDKKKKIVRPYEQK